MNFGATRAETLRLLGIDAVHWSAVGHPKDLDPVLLVWARANSHVLVTQDLGIASSLSMTDADGPSIFQLRHAEHEKELVRGCILVLDARTNRVRVRPLPTRPRR
jgi:predicted nuclease of predicted toxin-antitoxin system